jgi:hypothetical protein
MTSRLARSFALGLVVAASASCVDGEIGGESVDSAKGPLCTQLAPGKAPIRRMTRFEYDQTVRDLLGDTSDVAKGFVPEEESLGFNNQAEALGITQLLAEQLMEGSEQLAASATKDMTKLLPCDPAKAGEDACAAQFIQAFGKRAYRRPLDTDETTKLTAVYQKGKASYDFKTGIEWAIQAFLQSPQFLYRVEFGMPDPVENDVVKLTQYEIASRLSYLIWSSMPDETLFAAAEKGELATPEQIAAQAKRMLEDDRARVAVGNFNEQWLRLPKVDTLTKDTTYYPSYNDALRPLWKAETTSFLERLVFDENGAVADMFTAPYTMMNKDLADFYGASGPTGDTFEKVMLDPKRTGLLGHASILAVTSKANQSSPVHRGKFVRERFLCQGIPPPPANLKITPPEIKSGMTTRQRFDEHDKNPNCAICHKLMDPIGFGFEHFDGVGLWRDEDQNLPVDSSGEVVDSKDMNGKFDGTLELSKKLAGSEEVRECVATQWFRYGYGRGANDEDACNVDQLQTAFKASGYKIKDLLVALTQTDAFRYRHQVVPGGGQ